MKNTLKNTTAFIPTPREIEPPTAAVITSPLLIEDSNGNNPERPIRACSVRSKRIGNSTVTTGPPQVEQFLRRSEVCRLTGMGVSTLYEHMKAGKFPRPISLSPRLVVWREIDIAQWQAAHVAGREA